MNRVCKVRTQEEQTSRERCCQEAGTEYSNDYIAQQALRSATIEHRGPFPEGCLEQKCTSDTPDARSNANVTNKFPKGKTMQSYRNQGRGFLSRREGAPLSQTFSIPPKHKRDW
jgi:hypothetical protein